MLQYNIENNSFDEEEKINPDTVILAYCNQSENHVLTYVDSQYETICLHNENENYDKIAVDLFKLQDIRFKEFVDFFIENNNFNKNDSNN
jgi:hypothetical protein